MPSSRHTVIDVAPETPMCSTPSSTPSSPPSGMPRCGDYIPIVIGEIGWPTEGDINANISLAEQFYDGLMKKLAVKKGTPLGPDQDIEVYLFGLHDGDVKSTLPGDFERHWGMFTSDGQPKFPMDIAGTGEKKMPVAAKGVKYFAKKWCVRACVCCQC